MSWLSFLSSQAQQSKKADQRRARQTSQRPQIEQLEDRQLLATYSVGTGLAYTSLAAVPWTSLLPGDTVQIHWRPGGYHEKLLLAKSGTAAQPIRLVGIPDPWGQLPVIDGQNATTSSQFQFPFAGTQDRGVVVISLDRTQPWGYKPSYIQLIGLDIRNGFRGSAASPNTFTDGTGATRAYSSNAASIFVERGEHILIRGCTITGSGNGLFVASGGSEEVQSRDITVEHCRIYGNGNVGSTAWFEHNVYTEAIGVVFQYNYFGRLRAGSQGANLKDRSAGTVIRYNWIEGGSRLLDLVNPQEGANQEVADPSFHKTLVYGNVLLDQPGDAVALIHYGGDDYYYPDYRKDTLYFYNNTVVIQRDQSEFWRTMLFDLETPDQIVDVRNNIIFVQAATPGQTPSEFSLLNTSGTATVGANWVSQGWLVSRTGLPFTGTITGTSNLISNAQNDPGFVNLATYDLRLKSSSQAVDRGGALPAVVSQEYALLWEYVTMALRKPRSVVGSSSDLGAFEFGFLGSGNNEGLLPPVGGDGWGSGNNGGLLPPVR